ncbi:MAG: D-alanine--D-alanine ligase [Alphaproteobacteria bacterium]|nr:D-alanine--D-alanine ligase [Alphaproteobacteria bacterium]
MTKHVAVLMGGFSTEREVSLVSGQAVTKALREDGYRVTPIDAGRDIADVLNKLRPDVAFNALHGRFGEDGCVQGILEFLQIPYTHSGVLASAVAMHKPTAKRVFATAGLICPEGEVLNRQQVLKGGLKAPFVIKPLNEGSSVGVKIVFEGDSLAPLEGDNWPFGDEVLVERYIPGREIQVAVMGDRAFGAIEIRPQGRFYDYEAKYTAGRAVYLMPAPIDPDAYQRALDIGLMAHQVLGCRGVSRADLRYDDTAGEPGDFYLLEINTQPGMTPLSLVPKIAADVGVGFGALVRWLVENAQCDS